MKGTNSMIKMAFALGIITIISMIISALVLNEIHHSTVSNLDIEWNIIRMGFLFTAMFIVMSLATILKIRNQKQ